MYVANEGKLLAVVASEWADAALEAPIIGGVREKPARMVLMHTRYGGTTMIDLLVGDPLPRTC